MLDIFIHIPSYVFLILLFISMGIGWLWINLDDSTYYPLPELTNLNPLEMAVLRDGCRGITQTALFNLWQHRLIMVKGKGKKIKIVRSRKARQQLFTNIEELFYDFADSPRRAIDFFRDSQLQTQLKSLIKPIDHNLEKLHLKRTPAQLKQAWLFFGVTLLLLFTIVSMAGTKLYLETAAGKSMDLQLVFLIMIAFLTALIFILILFLIPNRSTRLGQRYQKKLKQHFAWMQEEPITNVNPIFCVAVFGVRVTDMTFLFHAFEKDFTSARPGGSTPGSSDGGDAGSGCGGGGCGGGG
jgi:uncharacterized protein (TIGR04222 family)